ncbi:MAG: hypothetical protein QF926_07000 [Alphaproteobacteria bacterium]|nr:hypothetical protein [Alphaproteobacteria bacterium]MDP6516352.1 hypothetical protein [Alphaproteobacteria bacterium]
MANRSGHQGRGIFWLAVLVVHLSFPALAEEAALPPGVVEIGAPQPLEISGVAAVPGGYAVVGDGTHDHGRVWPDGARWIIEPQVRGPESVDVGFAPGGGELWLVLGEDHGTLGDSRGGAYVFEDEYREICGRGLEGLAVRWGGGAWDVAVLWEGGFFEPDRPGCGPPGEFAKPRVALLEWVGGKGTDGPYRSFTLDVPLPGDGQRFRAPDLVWDDNRLLVLLAATDAADRNFDHTWLQRFDLAGAPVGAPAKLDEIWGAYWDGKNWEGLDWTLDGASLVMGFDAARGRRVLTVFPVPIP